MTVHAEGRVSEVLARLATVNDPELDDSVTGLGFVTGVTVTEGGQVAIGFRLPTYWCAANFAFLMADDMRAAVAGLPWVTGVRVELGDHMYAEKINGGIGAGHSFQESFGAEADGDLEQVRRTFLVKAFQRRQVALLEHLLSHGMQAGALASMSTAGLRDVVTDPEGKRLVGRYLERREIITPAGDDAHAFVDAAGQAVSADAFGAHLQALRRVAVNVEFNGALCRGLLAARFNEPVRESSEPGLLDFIRAVAVEQRSGV